jgi:hypothetical protein
MNSRDRRNLKSARWYVFLIILVFAIGLLLDKCFRWPAPATTYSLGGMGIEQAAVVPTAAQPGIVRISISDEDIPELDTIGLTAASKAVLRVIDRIAGQWVSPKFALIAFGIVLLALYRVLQAGVGRLRTPVGTFGSNMLAWVMGLIFGSEAAWKRRVLAAGTKTVNAQKAREQLLKKLGKDHPLVSDEIEEILRKHRQTRTIGMDKTEK